MQTNSRLRYLWYVLMCGILLMAILPGSSRMYQVVSAFDSNRWVHFLVYGMIVAIPFVVRRRGTGLWLPLGIVLAAIVIELLQTAMPGSNLRAHNIFPDLFGVGAGILLGLNLRKIRTIAKSEGELITDDSRSTLL